MIIAALAIPGDIILLTAFVFTIGYVEYVFECRNWRLLAFPALFWLGYLCKGMEWFG